MKKLGLITLALATVWGCGSGNEQQQGATTPTGGAVEKAAEQAAQKADPATVTKTLDAVSNPDAAKETGP